MQFSMVKAYGKSLRYLYRTPIGLLKFESANAFIHRVTVIMPEGLTPETLEQPAAGWRFHAQQVAQLFLPNARTLPEPFASLQVQIVVHCILSWRLIPILLHC